MGVPRRAVLSQFLQLWQKGLLHTEVNIMFRKLVLATLLCTGDALKTRRHGGPMCHEMADNIGLGPEHDLRMQYCEGAAPGVPAAGSAAACKGLTGTEASDCVMEYMANVVAK